LEEEISNHLHGQFKSQISYFVSMILEDFAKNALSPLAQSLQWLEHDLSLTLNQKAAKSDGGVFRNAPLPLWPSNSGVPSHFKPAINEVLLDDIHTFPHTFDAHIAQALMPIASNQINEAAAQIITRLQSVRDDQGNFLEIRNWPFEVTEGGSHPQIDRQQSWNPSAIGAVSSSRATAARYAIKLDHKSLLNNARKWVSLPDWPFKLYSEQGIAAWLQNNSELTFNQVQQKLARVQDSLSQTIKNASPATEIDQGLVSVVHHQLKTGGLSYIFSSLPFGRSDSALASVEADLQDSLQSSSSLANLKSACDPNRDVKEIFISSSTGAPYLPLVFKSLTEPIRNSWADVRANGAAKAFWTGRRARPLREFIPASGKWTEAFIQGWIMGRITGHIQLEARTDGVGGFIAKVFDEAQQNWASFPSELLGVNGLGVKKQAGGADESNWNIPAALLESLPLAMAHCQGMSLEPIRAYQLVTKIGATIRAKGASREDRQAADPTVVWDSPTGAGTDINNVLDVWVTHGGSAIDSFSQIASLHQAPNREKRIELALAWISMVEDRMRALLKNKISTNNLNEVNREYELAPELLRALDSVRRELVGIEEGVL
jgi:hypothetical protein